MPFKTTVLISALALNRSGGQMLIREELPLRDLSVHLGMALFLQLIDIVQIVDANLIVKSKLSLVVIFHE
jgi:hypothetical protein